MRHWKNIHCLLSKISLHFLTVSWSETSSYLPTVQLDFSWVLEMSNRQNDRFAWTSDNLNSSLSGTWHHLEEIQTLGHFIQNKQILKEEPINFYRLYDNEGPLSYPYGPIISSVRPFNTLSLVQILWPVV